MVDCIELISAAQNNAERVLVLIALVMMTLLVVVLVIVITLIFVAPLYFVIKDMFRANLIEGFYIDYMEIVEEVMSNRKLSSERELN